MSAGGRIPARAMEILAVIVVAALLALGSRAQPPAHARTLEPESSSAVGVTGARAWPRISSISAPPIEGFGFGGQQQRSNGPDVLRMVLLTLGAAAGAAFLGLIGYLIRKRVGFWPHRPQPQEGVGADEHH